MTIEDRGEGVDEDAGEGAAPSMPMGVRILWSAIAAAVLLLIVQVAFALRGPGDDGLVHPKAGELTVSAAIGRSPTRPVTVRGFVFMRRGFPPQLCSGRKPSSPPRCIGPFIDLSGLDESRLDLRRGTDGDVPVAWSDGTVALLGTMNGSAMAVTEIVS